MEREVLSLLYVNYAILIVLLTILWLVYFGVSFIIYSRNSSQIYL